MSEPLWQAIITSLGVVLVGYFSYLASRRARLAREIAEEVRDSISTTNGGGHLKDDMVELKIGQKDAAEALAVVKIALVRIEGLMDSQSRDIKRLDLEDAKRAAAASEAHSRIHERIDDLVQKRRGWRH